MRMYKMVSTMEAMYWYLMCHVPHAIRFPYIYIIIQTIRINAIMKETISAMQER